ncbi:MAG TPA: PRC-barrel domain-containing protein [Gaiellaceae bacterium]|nr:PRC-barrel domain-containing protein [Gaiellaceae bacterium]
MRISELLASVVVDESGRRVGRVRDVRLAKDDLRVVGLVVGDGFLADAAVAWGFADGRARGPWPLERLTAHAVQRITFVPVERVARWDHGEVVLA